MARVYQKERVIGSGTFGNVWLVKSKISNYYFVLKEINLGSMSATDTRQALNEVTVLSRCRHRNIVKYKDAVIDHKKGVLSIIMEYADGGDLYTAISKQRGVPFKEHTIITWFTQICLALQYIHHKGILHRDLKSRNIFLTRERQIKVGDFGIARCLTETEELATTAIGTPYYLSPEICHRKPYNHKSDMWALGCILFEMAALSLPFQASNFPHLLVLIITGKRKDLPSHCSQLVQDLVEKLIEDDPDMRPSANDVLAMPSLQPYLAELWVVQNTSSSSLSKLLNEEVSLRRHSLSDMSRNSLGFAGMRRASITSGESRGIRSRFGFINKGKNIQVSKHVPCSRSHSVKVHKHTPNAYAVKKEHSLTYKIFNVSTLKERITNVLSNGSKSLRTVKENLKGSFENQERHSESDSGYQNEEHLKYFSDKTNDFTAGNFRNVPRTSTKKRIDASDFFIEQSMDDNVFDDNSSTDMQVNPSEHKNEHTECSHSQCQQCMLNILWKNRIRGTVGPLVETPERTQLIGKLQEVFGDDFFDTIYNILITNWDSENLKTPKALKDITNSLNYSQLQHLPLMMQLIQLDLVIK